MQTSARTRGKRPGKEATGVCTVTADDLISMLEKQNFRCAASNLPLALVTGHKWVMSVDRLDNDKGYTPDNIRLVVKRLNGVIFCSPAIFATIKDSYMHAQAASTNSTRVYPTGFETIIHRACIDFE